MRRIFVFAMALCIFLSAGRAFAGEASSPEEQYRLGLRYQLGDGVQKDMQKAFSLYKKSAEQGYPPAQFAMGICHEMGGHGVVQDGRKAAFWYEKAARQGHTKAQLNLGNLYWFEDKGVLRNEQKAMDWWFVAAVNGEPEAQLYLAHRYFQISEKNRDHGALAKAHYWYREAAGQGMASAQYALGVMYQTGRPMQKDMKAALHWYKKAAVQGHKEAKKRLGELGH